MKQQVAPSSSCFSPRIAFGWRLWSFAALLLLALSGGARAQGNDTSPTYSFRSSPDCHAPILDITINRPDLVTPGYIFFALYRNLQPGPYIYDNYGNLVWSGACSSGPKVAHSPRTCEYKGSTHLCYFTGEQHQGFARGHGVIMNQNYKIVETVESSGCGSTSDMHEFKITPYSNGTSAIMTVYHPLQYDLTTNPKFNLGYGMGWIVEGVFQEVDIETERVLFEWRSLDHVDPGLSWTMPGTTDTSGDGLTDQSAWDYFHINSVDKNEEGDYLISARHVSAIYKLSGKDGSIMWEMGGMNPTFQQTNFNFSYQHHASWISENSTHTVLSFYDNASNGFNSTSTCSNGFIIAIDHIAKSATMLNKYGAPDPEGGLLSGSQGSIQVLPNGNVHLGWGENPRFSEHLPDGATVQYAEVAQRASNAMIYRSHKYNWTATPLTTPKMAAFSKHGDERSGTYIWVSWNGATEVRWWRFYGAETRGGPYALLGDTTKTGFETEFHSRMPSLWSFAEALDVNGTVLSRSAYTRTTVPREGLATICHDRGCPDAIKLEGDDYTPYEADMLLDEQYFSTRRGYDTSEYYPSLLEGLALYTKTGIHAGVILVPLGLMAMLVGVTLAAWLWRRGRFEPLAEKVHRQTLGLSGGISKSVFGSKIRGAYTRVREKETEFYESGSSSSSGSGGMHG